MPCPLPAFAFKSKWQQSPEPNGAPEEEPVSKDGTADSAWLFLLWFIFCFSHRRNVLGKSPRLHTTGKDKMDNRTEELEMELVSSLETFGRLYDQKVECLHRVSYILEQMAASVYHDLCMAKTVTCLFGGFSGGIFGTISALVWSDGHAEDVTFGIIGSILGGVAGGALGGAISGAGTILSKLAGGPVRDVTSETAGLFGFAAGGGGRRCHRRAPGQYRWCLGRRVGSLLGGSVHH